MNISSLQNSTAIYRLLQNQASTVQQEQQLQAQQQNQPTQSNVQLGPTAGDPDQDRDIDTGKGRDIDYYA